MARKEIFTSESVTRGHPDKVCDQIADAILDALLSQDSNSRCACEVTCTKNKVHIFGEVSTTADVDYEAVARSTIAAIGYDNRNDLFNHSSAIIEVNIHQQSPDIASSVIGDGEVIGAGDQGIMFGYACNETSSYMPTAIEIAHDLCHRLDQVRQNEILPILKPDGKSQVSVVYKNGVPDYIDTILLSAQHEACYKLKDLREDLHKYVVDCIPCTHKKLITNDTRLIINPSTQFVVGGPEGDSGVTGRKIIVDSYGGYGRHGGGAFSGKDASKVDRSAAYMARYIAKNIVAAELADKCEIQLAYAIGVAQPVAIWIDTFGTESVNLRSLEKMIKKKFDLRPEAIIEMLNLRAPIYSDTAYYGHFGKYAKYKPWEVIDTDLF